MKYFIKKMIPILLAITILGSIGWYFLIYDITLTRDLMIQQARRFEENGKTSAAVWLYNLAYLQSGNDAAVAIELAEQFKSLGNYSKAESTLAKAIQDGGNVDVYIALCKTYVEQDKLRDAVTMLDRVGNKQIKAELDALRPKAPVASAESGSYTQYLSIEITSSTDKLCVSSDLDYPSVVTDIYTGPIVLPSGKTTLYAVSIAENGLVSPMATFGYLVHDVVEEVIFTDSHVEAALRLQLQIPAGHSIYSDVLGTVESFTMPAKATSCADLKWVPKLKNLTIEDATFTDFTPLSALTELRTLEVKNSNIANGDLSFLQNMSKLNHLTLSGCGISTLVALENITTLKYLDLSSNTVRNVSYLSHMTELEELHMANNALINLQDLQTLQNLKVLDVSYNALSTTSHVSALTSLTWLDVSSNNLTKLEGIGELVELRHFAASHNNLIDVNILQTCTKLQTLDVSYNTLITIQVAIYLLQLEELDFSHNEVSKLPEFRGNCSLQIIRGEHNLLSSLDTLSGLLHLTHVYMDYNTKLSNINSLRHCPLLQEVYVYGTKVTNISMLADAGILVHYTPKT